mmetsp:Transcript_41609/g.77492  ORF Transcript_41609/g.77492 Transcript_41609/m.77492 type:complete len:256 (+) Transcript_41609:1881-2648(+)
MAQSVLPHARPIVSMLPGMSQRRSVRAFRETPSKRRTVRSAKAQATRPPGVHSTAYGDLGDASASAGRSTRANLSNLSRQTRSNQPCRVITKTAPSSALDKSMSSCAECNLPISDRSRTRGSSVVPGSSVSVTSKPWGGRCTWHQTSAPGLATMSPKGPAPWPQLRANAGTPAISCAKHTAEGHVQSVTGGSVPAAAMNLPSDDHATWRQTPRGPEGKGLIAGSPRLLWAAHTANTTTLQAWPSKDHGLSKAVAR